MSALVARLQGDFQDYLLRGSGAVEPHVVGTARVPVRDAPGYLRQRLPQPPCRGARQQFPGAGGAARRTDFDALAAAYVHTHDSPYFSIRYYGE